MFLSIGDVFRHLDWRFPRKTTLWRIFISPAVGYGVCYVSDVRGGFLVVMVLNGSLLMMIAATAAFFLLLFALSSLFRIPIVSPAGVSRVFLRDISSTTVRMCVVSMGRNHGSEWRCLKMEKGF